MDYLELVDRLAALPDFGDRKAWRVDPILCGEVSPHKYRIRARGRDFFVKEIRQNESRTLRLLAYLGLDICPRILHPELLNEQLLIAEYIPGGALRQKKLQTELVINYCVMQNALNDRRLFESVEAFARCGFHDVDEGGFYRRLIDSACEEGYPRLLALREYELPIVENYIRVAELMLEHRGDLANAYGAMPFAWLHHDFREDNIVGSPQKLVDWGSSYGHGPFLFDLAPFLINERSGLRTFSAHSDVCRRLSPLVIERHLFAATYAGFAGFLLWRIKAPDEPGGNWKTREQCRDFLQYEYQSFAPLASDTPTFLTYTDRHRETTP